MIMHDIGIIGTGRIGRGIAPIIVEKCSKLYLYNRDKEKAEGVRDDLMKDNVEVVSLEEIVEKTDIVIIAAGIHTSNRADAFEENRKLMEYFGGDLFKGEKDKLYIIISSPSDENSYVFYKKSEIKNIVGFNPDCERLNFLIKDLIKNKSLTSEKFNVESFVVGTHNKFMVPVLSRTNIIKGNGNVFSFYDELLGIAKHKEEIIDTLIKYGPEQIKKIGSSTRISTAQALGKVIDAINNQQSYVCVSFLFDLFHRKTFLGWPVKFNGLDAVPLIDNKRLSDFLDNEEYNNFIRAYDNSITFLESYKY